MGAIRELISQDLLLRFRVARGGPVVNHAPSLPESAIWPPAAKAGPYRLNRAGQAEDILVPNYKKARKLSRQTPR
jgi:hypothetical protein